MQFCSFKRLSFRLAIKGEFHLARKVISSEEIHSSIFTGVSEFTSPQFIHPSSKRTMTAVDSLDFSDLEQKYAVHLDESFQNFVFIGGLPVVEEGKKKKLLSFLQAKGLFSEVQLVQDPHFPCSSDSILLGFAFFQVASKEQAELLAKRADGFVVDNKTTLFALTFDEFQQTIEMPDEYVQPSIPEYTDRPFLYQWILDDPSVSEQFMTFHWDKRGNVTQVFEMPSSAAICDDSTIEEPVATFKRPNLCDSRVEWSPNGTYLVSYHVQGIALWMPLSASGDKSDDAESSYQRVVRFSHSSVSSVSFSFDERFVYTQSEQESFIWDIETGFKVFTLSSTSKSCKFSFCKNGGHFFYTLDSGSTGSPDGCTGGALRIYQIIQKEECSFIPTLIHSVTGGNVMDAEWGNVKPILAYWIGEQENSPARVSLIACQPNSGGGSSTIRQLKSKTLFLVRSCHFAWHPQDTFLALLVDRWNKTKKSSNVNFEIFRLAERDIPVDNVECPPGQSLVHFAWEPSAPLQAVKAGGRGNSHKFATIVRDDLQGTSHLVFWEDRKDPKQPVRQFSPIGKYERKFIDRLYWSPKGRFLLACNISTNSSGNFELWDAQPRSMVASMEHEQLSQVVWAPNGLQFCSFSSFSEHSGAENGFLLWDLRGNQVLKKSIEKFEFLLYRPIPTRLLNPGDGKLLMGEEDLVRVQGTLSDRFKEFELADAKLKASTQKSTEAHRQSVLSAWNEWKEQCKQRYESMTSQRNALKGATLSSSGTAEDNLVDVEEMVEEVIEEQQIFCK